jgi:hypothetical protein
VTQFLHLDDKNNQKVNLILELKETFLQVEAESRKNEFAKLLEEHAQVIKELKQMEDDPPSGAVAGPTEA